MPDEIQCECCQKFYPSRFQFCLNCSQPEGRSKRKEDKKPMTVEEARKKFNIGEAWRELEMPDGRIFFSFYEDDIIVRKDGTAYLSAWGISPTFAPLIVHTEIPPGGFSWEKRTP